MPNNQLEVKFSVRRISTINNWRSLIKHFNNEISEELTEYLYCKKNGKSQAFEDDKINENAVYLVVDTETNEIAHYFALKNTCLFKVSSFMDLQLLYAKGKVGKKLRTPKSYPAVEMSIFCNNDNYSKIELFNIEKEGLGYFVFHKIIYPKVTELAVISGCRYLCLYAAEKSGNKKKLINYYKYLGFRTLEEVQPKLLLDENSDIMFNKKSSVSDKEFFIIPPQDDFDGGCYFMCCPIRISI